MHKLINTKHHCSRSVHEHIMYLSDLGAKLNALKMRLDDPFMIHFALVSLHVEYGNLVSSYSNMKEKWTIDEFISHDVQRKD
jgi:RNA processing factor Prp31